MLAISHQRGLPWRPWNYRMSDLPEATAKAREKLAQSMCPSAVVRYLEAYGYSLFVAQMAVEPARDSNSHSMS